MKLILMMICLCMWFPRENSTNEGENNENI